MTSTEEVKDSFFFSIVHLLFLDISVEVIADETHSSPLSSKSACMWVSNIFKALLRDIIDNDTESNDPL